MAMYNMEGVFANVVGYILVNSPSCEDPCMKVE